MENFCVDANAEKYFRKIDISAFSNFDRRLYYRTKNKRRQQTAASWIFTIMDKSQIYLDQ